MEGCDPSALAFRHRQAVRQRRRPVPHSKPVKAAVSGGSLPEHSQQEGRKQRRIHEGEHQLQEIHDVVELRRQVGGRDRKSDTDHRGYASHPEIMLSGAFFRI